MADEPRSLVVPQERPGAAQNVGTAIPALPGRLVGGTAIKAVSNGLSWSISLDIDELSPAPSGFTEDNVWLPALFGSSGVTYRLTLAELSAELPIAWTNITGKPSTYPPTLPITQNGVTGLTARLDGVDTTLTSYGTRITNVETTVATKIGDAPNDGLTYGRKNAAWTAVAALTDGNKGDIVVSSTGTIWTIGLGAVSDAALRNSAALSVIGRSSNSSGSPADISASTDGQVLRRSGAVLGFGTVATGGLTDDAATNAKLANMAVNTIKGRVTTGTGDPEDLTAAQARSVTGQKWVGVYDQLVTGGSAFGFDVPLLGYDIFRITLRTIPNTAMASNVLRWFGSNDGGSTFKSGVSDYQSSYLLQSSTSVVGAGQTSASFGQMTGLISSAFGTLSCVTEAILTRGVYGETRMFCGTSYFDGTSYAQIFMSSASSAMGSTMNVLRIATAASAFFAPGSRLIVEAC